MSSGSVSVADNGIETYDGAAGKIYLILKAQNLANIADPTVVPSYWTSKQLPGTLVDTTYTPGTIFGTVREAWAAWALPKRVAQLRDYGKQAVTLASSLFNVVRVTDTDVTLDNTTSMTTYVEMNGLTAPRNLIFPTAPLAGMSIYLAGDATVASFAITVNGSGAAINGNSSYLLGPGGPQIGVYSTVMFMFDGVNWTAFGAVSNSSLVTCFESTDTSVSLVGVASSFVDLTINSMTANRTVTLPNSPPAGQTVDIGGDSSLGSFKITISGNFTIDGASSLILGLGGTAFFTSGYTNATLRSNGTEWRIK